MSTACQIEQLEGRRLFSVTAASLVVLTKGATWTMQTLQGTSVVSTETATVVGSAAFNSIKCTRIKATATSSQGPVTVNTYTGFDKSGNAVNYGSITSGSAAGFDFTTTITYSPASIVLPATLKAKVTKSFVWNGSDVTTEAGNTTTNTEHFNYKFRMPSATKQKVKVPAGTFSAYVVDVTISEVVSGQTISTTAQEWLAPGVGAVKIVSSSGTITEMTKFRK